jgi:hypothetical protein
MLHKVDIDLFGTHLSIETGVMAKQADGAIIVRSGDNVVLVTACCSGKPRAGASFFPLTVDYREGTYAAAEYLRDRFERVVVLSPRETIAEEAVLVARQRIHRRFFERGIEVKTWVDPVWSEHFENTGCLQYRSVFGGPLQDIENVAFFAYASPRRPDDTLLGPLQAAGLTLSRVGDCKSARDALAATAEGHEAGMGL